MNIRVQKSGTLLMAVAVWQMLAGPSAAAPGWDASAGTREPVYDFTEHLDQAEAWAVNEEGAEVIGDWKTDRFVFTGLESKAEMREIETDTDFGKKAQIQFNPLPRVYRRVRFFKVPVSSGTELVFSYKITVDEAKPKTSYMNIRIFAGGHLFYLIRVPSDPAETSRRIPLGLAGFIGRPIDFTFEVYTDSDAPVSLSFAADIR